MWKLFVFFIFYSLLSRLSLTNSTWASASRRESAWSPTGACNSPNRLPIIQQQFAAMDHNLWYSEEVVHRPRRAHAYNTGFITKLYIRRYIIIEICTIGNHCRNTNWETKRGKWKPVVSPSNEAVIPRWNVYYHSTELNRKAVRNLSDIINWNDRELITIHASTRVSGEICRKMSVYNFNSNSFSGLDTCPTVSRCKLGSFSCRCIVLCLFPKTPV